MRTSIALLFLMGLWVNASKGASVQIGGVNDYFISAVTEGAILREGGTTFAPELAGKNKILHGGYILETNLKGEDFTSKAKFIVAKIEDSMNADGWTEMAAEDVSQLHNPWQIRLIRHRGRSVLLIELTFFAIQNSQIGVSYLQRIDDIKPANQSTNPAP